MKPKGTTSLLQSITDLLSSSVVQAVLGILVLLAVSLVAYYILQKLRVSSSEEAGFVDSLQKNFEEMRSGGDINEAEFRKIKASLSGEKNSNLNPNDTSTRKL
jgi:uncharacterized membrane protein